MRERGDGRGGNERSPGLAGPESSLYLPHGGVVSSPGEAPGGWHAQTPGASHCQAPVTPLQPGSACPETPEYSTTSAPLVHYDCLSPDLQILGWLDPRGMTRGLLGKGLRSQPPLLPPQRSARPSRCLTVTAMASSPSRSWVRPCAPWATCPTRWSWRLSSNGWTWMVSTSPGFSFLSPGPQGWGRVWGLSHRGLVHPGPALASPTPSHTKVCCRLQPDLAPFLTLEN